MILLFEFILYISCCVNFFFFNNLSSNNPCMIIWPKLGFFESVCSCSRMMAYAWRRTSTPIQKPKLLSYGLYIYIYIYIYEKYLTFICTPSKSLSSNMSPINRSTGLAIKVFNNLSSALFKAQGLVFLLNHEN
jgi:hypothetical protein